MGVKLELEYSAVRFNPFLIEIWDSKAGKVEVKTNPSELLKVVAFLVKFHENPYKKLKLNLGRLLLKTKGQKIKMIVFKEDKPNEALVSAFLGGAREYLISERLTRLTSQIEEMISKFRLEPFRNVVFENKHLEISYGFVKEVIPYEKIDVPGLMIFLSDREGGRFRLPGGITLEKEGSYFSVHTNEFPIVQGGELERICFERALILKGGKNDWD